MLLEPAQTIRIIEMRSIEIFRYVHVQIEYRAIVEQIPGWHPSINSNGTVFGSLNWCGSRSSEKRRNEVNDQRTDDQ